MTKGTGYLKLDGKSLPEMSGRVSTIEYQLLLWINILIDPSSPGLQGLSIGLNRIKLWINIISLSIVVFPVSSNLYVKLLRIHHLFKYSYKRISFFAWKKSFLSFFFFISLTTDLSSAVC